MKRQSASLLIKPVIVIVFPLQCHVGTGGPDDILNAGSDIKFNFSCFGPELLTCSRISVVFIQPVVSVESSPGLADGICLP